MQYRQVAIWNGCCDWWRQLDVAPDDNACNERMRCRLWAEIFEVQEENGDICWGRVSDDVVPVNITCLQNQPTTVFQITAYSRHVEKIFDVRIIQPGRLTIKWFFKGNPNNRILQSFENDQGQANFSFRPKLHRLHLKGSISTLYYYCDNDYSASENLINLTRVRRLFCDIS